MSPKAVFTTALFAAVILSAHGLDYLGAPCTGSMCDNGMECLSVTGGNCTWDGLSSYAACSCGGVGGENDPYFTGFSEQSFYFSAEAGNTYNIFSEQTHTVNAHFVATELPEESDLLSMVTGAQNSSFIGAVSLQHGNTTVDVLSDKAGEITVRIDGKELGTGGFQSDFEATLSLADNVTVRIEKFPNIYTNIVSVETDLLAVNILPEKAHNDNMGNNVRGHLSMQMSLKVGREAVPPIHGVLGQTVRSEVQSEVQDAFPGEGSPSDYIVSSLHDSDFKFSLLGQQPLVPAFATAPAARPAAVVVSSSRKLLNGSRQIVDLQGDTRLTASYGAQRLTSMSSDS